MNPRVWDLRAVAVCADDGQWLRSANPSVQKLTASEQRSNTAAVR